MEFQVLFLPSFFLNSGVSQYFIQTQTMLYVSSKAITQNYQYFKSKLNQNTKIMVMIKANLYGHGAVKTAKLFQKLGANYLGISHLIEGIELRTNNISIPIFVISSDPHLYEEMIKYKLEPTIQDLLSLRKFIEAAKNNCVENYPIHLNLDTGMHRAGFMEAQIEELINFIQLENKNYFTIKSVYTHLAASDDPDHDKFTLSQIHSFQKYFNKICDNLSLKQMPLKHCLNSAGAERFSHYQFDMVRLGKGLLGFSSINNSLKKAATFKVKIIQIKQLGPNDGEVGYGRHGRLRPDRKTKIATLSAGYADGINFRLGNGKAKFGVKGKLAPTIGNICMDMSMIDISEINNVSVGDEVTIFGSCPSIQQLAEIIDTNKLQILTSVGRRIQKVLIEQLAEQNEGKPKSSEFKEQQQKQ